MTADKRTPLRKLKKIKNTLTNIESGLRESRFCDILNNMKNLIDCAMKREKCDLVLKGTKIFNVFTGTFEEGELAVKNGKIVGIGTGFEAETVYDGSGLYALPGLIDSHIHVESSMLSPEEFAALSCAHGTSTIVADPHEIVNVCGIGGAEYMSEAFSRLTVNGVQPLDVCLQLPSCVPATPFETSGAVLNGEETKREIGRSLFFGLGEMMNFPAVIGADEDNLKKMTAALENGKIIDGHAPGLTGDALNAYAAAGIRTDHECLNAGDCREKLAHGLYVQLRNGSSAHNLEENCKAMDGYNYRRFILCSDDRNAHDLSEKGEMDDALRRLVACGIPAERAICTATLNTAECYGMKGKGALAPSYDADIVLVENVTDFRVRAVFKKGVLVAKDGSALFRHDRRYLSDAVKSTVRIKPVCADDFKIENKSGKERAMRVRPHGIVTEEEIVSVTSKNGDVLLTDDMCKLAVIERHFATGNMGKCLVKGYGLKGGAIGVTVAHDSHNMVILGDNNADMARVAKLLERAGGGMAVAGGGTEDVFPLDIAGLMSSAPAQEVIERTKAIADRARGMGVNEGIEPFMTMVFLSLAVIPKLRLTDKGLVDVDVFGIVGTEV